MPFFPLPNDESQGALYYEIFSGSDSTASGLDPGKETILFFPAQLAHQYDDSRLRARFNLVGIEPRHVGRSHAKPLPEYDVAVGAADIAFFLNDLNFPAVHLFSPQATSNPIALRLAALFPERVLSLTIAGPNPVAERERSPEKDDVYQAMLQAWGTGSDVEAWAEATHELEVMVFGTDGDKDEVDLWAHNLGSRCRYQPVDHFNFAMSFLQRKSIPREFLASVKAPVFIITGTEDLYAGEVDWYTEHLSGTEVSSFRIESAGHGLANTAPNVVNRSLIKFLTNTPWPKERALQPVKTDFEAALKRLPELTREKIDISGRRANTPSHFFVKTHEEIEGTKAMAEYMFSGQLPAPRIAWGWGGPIYNHDPKAIAYRFSQRHDSLPEIEPGTPEPGRFDLKQWTLPDEH